jgi:D-3-phosphoglycerate dehydrogenase
MTKKILVAPIFKNTAFASEPRSQGLEGLKQLAAVEEYSQEEMTAEHAQHVVAVIANSTLFTSEFYAAAEDLRIIARWGVGFDKVNLDVATEHGVIVTVTPVHMDTVAEYTIAQWMATLKRTYTLNRASHQGDFTIIRTFEAQGSTLGLYGFGRIGQQVALRAKPLLGESGRLLVYDIRDDISDLAAQYGAEVVESPQVLFEECDTVSLHVAGDEPIVTYDLLAAMKPHASLINPSRGNLVDDEAVNRAIREDRLFYYVVDDPVNGPREIHKDEPRIICTNHNGGITVESVIRLDCMTFSQVSDVLQGRRPKHILNTQVLDHPRVQSFLNEELK